MTRHTSARQSAHAASPEAGANRSALPVEVRRSARRRRTVSAYEERGRLVVLIPDSFTAKQEREWVERMRDRLAAKRTRPRPGDDDLLARAARLSDRYLRGQARPSSVRWVDNQRRRWGSCTPAHGTIRLSDELQRMPPTVVDYVLLHELAHLLEPGHGPRFWGVLGGYPHLEWARGYLQGYAAAAHLPTREDDADDGPDEPDADSARGDSARGDSARGDSARGDSARGDSARGDSAGGDSARADTARGAGASAAPRAGGDRRPGQRHTATIASSTAHTPSSPSPT